MSVLAYVRIRILVAGALAALALALPGSLRADNPTLVGSTGPGYSITLKNPDGTAVKHLDPGTYTIVIHDLSAEHNYHLTGPGVDVSTGVEETGDATWTVTFTDGTYRFQCDVHAAFMKGDFTVGTVPVAPPPAPPKKLLATVGPGFSIGLKTAAGARVRSLPAGAYTIVVRDRASVHNFHLVGPGLNRKTGVAFKGTATWKVRLAAGVYRFRCDPHASALKGSFRVT